MPDSPLAVTLDVGSSSVRALLFDLDGRELEGFGEQIAYEPRKTPDGGFEIDPDHLFDAVARSLDTVNGQLRQASLKPAVVALDTFWHSFTAVDSDGRPLTPIYHLFDTRSAAAAEQLAGRIDNRAQHARTGCVLHPSYYPAKLLWLSETQPDVCRRAARYLSPGEYFFRRLFGEAVASTSMMSATGLWDQNRNDYDAGILSALPIKPEQLASKQDLDAPRDRLQPEFKSRWPSLDGIPWFPTWGDGAANNVGSGCIAQNVFSVMVGTSGAMRAVIESGQVDIKPGLWCYRVDSKRFILGGALSDGGSVYAWLKATLKLPSDQELEAQIAVMPPAAHGITALPLFAGERSTGWRPQARAAFTGIAAHSTPAEIVKASLEGVALRFRDIYDQMLKSIGRPETLIASGGALLHSRAWTQMMADALGRRLESCTEKEATSRGAALLGFERIRAISHIADPKPLMGPAFDLQPEFTHTYERMLATQKRLYSKLYEENW